jgi:hypothetical protein
VQKDVNVFLNFQITQRKGELAMLISQACYNKKIEEMPEELERFVDHTIMDKVEDKNQEIETKLQAVKKELVMVKAQNPSILKTNSKLEQEVDATRQRGLKGNLLISMPNQRDVSPHPLFVQQSKNGRLESHPEMFSRIIQKKTCVHIPPSGLVTNHSPGSVWESLYTGVMTSKKQGPEQG